MSESSGSEPPEQDREPQSGILQQPLEAIGSDISSVPELRNDLKRNDLKSLVEKRQQEEIENSQSDRVMRENLAQQVPVITVGWLAGVILLLLLSGSKIGCNIKNYPIAFGPFNLSDSVLIALLGTTGCIGLFAIVLRYLFHIKKEEFWLEESSTKSKEK